MKINPTNYFHENDIGSSSLLSLLLDEERARLTVTVVCDSAVVPQDGSGSQWVRDFRELRFAGVSSVRREGTEYRRNLQHYEQDDLNIYPQHWGMHEIQGATATWDGNGYRIALDCGSLGTYRFTCLSLSIARRFGMGVRTSITQWDYFDAETGAFFDFWYPFANSDSE